MMKVLRNTAENPSIQSQIRPDGFFRRDSLLVVPRRVELRLLHPACLREMGVGEDIILVAFGLSMGALAVAAAIAFGIGGRDIAKRKLESWTKKIDEPKEQK